MAAYRDWGIYCRFQAYSVLYHKMAKRTSHQGLNLHLFDFHPNFFVQLTKTGLII